MANEQRILVALDDSEASQRALAYTGSIAAGTGKLSIVLCHVLAPLPPAMLEFRGAENPREERVLDAEIERQQRHYLERERATARALMERARSALEKAGVAPGRIETRFGEVLDEGEKLVERLRAEAAACDCGTIVVGRKSFSALKEFLHKHVGDELAREAEGLAVWVVH